MRMREKALLFNLTFAVAGILLAVQIERWLQLGGVALFLLLPVGVVAQFMIFICPHCGDSLFAGPDRGLGLFRRQCHSCGNDI